MALFSKGEVVFPALWDKRGAIHLRVQASGIQYGVQGNTGIVATPLAFGSAVGFADDSSGLWTGAAMGEGEDVSCCILHNFPIKALPLTRPSQWKV